MKGRYNLGSALAAINKKVIDNEMTRDECDAHDIPVYYSVCKYGHKLKYVSNNSCVDCSAVHSRKAVVEVERVERKRKLDELSARRELEAIERGEY
jgi:hypothetical protein